MNWKFSSQEEMENFIKNEVLTTSEVAEILDIGRDRVNRLIREGKLIPLKKVGSVCLFMRSYILEKEIEYKKLRLKYRPYD
ncbi:DNA-binding protein [Bacillus cereus]|uniref:helix-turn-helix domain-containing protein n=1 Tax=Bacillus cereus group TaxID=86661 RepID=UPI000978C7BC|nr:MULTISPECIES: helix-turn-helix domain-containing protein [Bacillus cereus group]ONG97462.1 DNA-binding protein [Bacillus cereus]HDR7741139.1 helix-turn-helix domain-containing protein [Bacillus pacificus]MCU5288549.1 helix-turn-helix domain-containing protein [Bacillus paranthracis]MDH2866136.1 helix-turn-helix domain-containing protein [Bacillus cytotoxicus]NZD34379.1 helix-turn-helix domain-containing protein [Bacillus cytotoxicus]